MTAKREKPLHLDINFDEALRRYIGTDPRELSEPNKVRKPARRKRVRKDNQSESNSTHKN
jgi:hypothetical protein